MIFAKSCLSGNDPVADSYRDKLPAKKRSFSLSRSEASPETRTIFDRVSQLAVEANNRVI